MSSQATSAQSNWHQVLASPSDDRPAGSRPPNAKAKPNQPTRQNRTCADFTPCHNMCAKNRLLASWNLVYFDRKLYTSRELVERIPTVPLSSSSSQGSSVYSGPTSGPAPLTPDRASSQFRAHNPARAVSSESSTSAAASGWTALSSASSWAPPGVSTGGRGRRACRSEYPRVPPVTVTTVTQGDQEGLFAPINRSHLVSFRICFQKWITIKCKEVMRV